MFGRAIHFKNLTQPDVFKDQVLSVFFNTAIRCTDFFKFILSLISEIGKKKFSFIYLCDTVTLSCVKRILETLVPSTLIEVKLIKTVFIIMLRVNLNIILKLFKIGIFLGKNAISFVDDATGIGSQSSIFFGIRLQITIISSGPFSWYS